MIALIDNLSEGESDEWMKFHEMHENNVAKQLKTNIEHGLSSKVVQSKQKQFGWNELEGREKQSLLLLFFNQFKDFMVLILLAATLLSGLLGEYIDAIAIMAIVTLNSFLGFFQERRAEKSLHALKQLSTPQISVLRDGKWMKKPAKEVVVGDILKFSSGDRIGADMRIVAAHNLEIEESALTGESVPTPKKTDPLPSNKNSLGDLENMAFMGTMVTRGHGVGIVTAIGMKTAMGQIADMIQNAEVVTTPLQRRLEQLGKILITVALFLTILVVFVGVAHGHDLYTMFLAGVSLAVASIPEGLPTIVTVSLSLGVQRMIKQKAIVRKLSAVETLGCASIICSDKTGTMTQNKMTVTHLWSAGTTWTVSGTGYIPEGSFYLQEELVEPQQQKYLHQLLSFGLLCNHAEILKKDKEFIIDGDPTEGALLVAAMKAGMSRKELMQDYTIEKEYPFDSKRKMMSMVIKDKQQRRFVITKGAPDVLIQRSKAIQWDKECRSLNAKEKQAVLTEVDMLAEKALRTIAIAYRPLYEDPVKLSEEVIENNLIFLGLQGMIDPPRPEVKEAVKECREAGIKTIMITGDHVVTAKVIAHELGIFHNKSMVLDGQSLDQMTIEDLQAVAESVSVFARVSPEHKLMIVKALQKKGHIVAMTGDGVNDAPAIKSADIGIAMGITGTDVAKEASSLVLLDDNFATIKAAIKEGRNIYENIRKFVRYLLASNVGEILVMLFAMLLSLPLPLVPIQILWVNLVTDGLPAMALGLDKPEEDVMKRKPRHPKEGVFARRLGWKVISRGFLIGVVTLIAFIIIYYRNPADLPYAQTVAFATLVAAQLIHVFDCRSEHSVLSRNPFGNQYLLWAVIFSFAMMIAVIYVPVLQPIFHTVSIAKLDWLLIIGLSALPTFLLAGSIFATKRY